MGPVAPAPSGEDVPPMRPKRCSILVHPDEYLPLSKRAAQSGDERLAELSWGQAFAIFARDD